MVTDLIRDVWVETSALHRDGEVTLEKKLSYNSSYFREKNSGTIVTSVTVTTIMIWLRQ